MRGDPHRRSYTWELIMLTCEKCEKILARYLCGALPPWSRSAVAKHLDQCPPCQRAIEAHYRLDMCLECLPADDPPAGLWDRVASEVAQEKPGYERIPHARTDWRPGLLVAAAGLTAGVFMGQVMNIQAPAPESDIASIEHPSPQIAPVVQYHSQMAEDHPLADPVTLALYETAAYRDAERLGRGAGSAP
jgi:hypothetical protein